MDVLAKCFLQSKPRTKWGGGGGGDWWKLSHPLPLYLYKTFIFNSQWNQLIFMQVPLFIVSRMPPKFNILNILWDLLFILWDTSFFEIFSLHFVKLPLFWEIYFSFCEITFILWDFYSFCETYLHFMRFTFHFVRLWLFYDTYPSFCKTYPSFCKIYPSFCETPYILWDMPYILWYLYFILWDWNLILWDLPSFCKTYPSFCETGPLFCETYLHFVRLTLHFGRLIPYFVRHAFHFFRLTFKNSPLSKVFLYLLQLWPCDSCIRCQVPYNAFFGETYPFCRVCICLFADSSAYFCPDSTLRMSCCVSFG